MSILNKFNNGSWELYNRTQRLGHVIVTIHFCNTSFNATIHVVQYNHSYPSMYSTQLFIQCKHSCHSMQPFVYYSYSTIRSFMLFNITIHSIHYSHSIFIECLNSWSFTASIQANVVIQCSYRYSCHSM